MWRINKDSIDFKWGYFAPRFGFEFMVHRGGYFDQHYAISWCLIWGQFHIKVPFKTRIPGSCDTPNYGIQIHNNTFWLHLGGKMNDWEQCDSKWITWDLPFFSWIHDLHQVWTGKKWVNPGGEYSEPYSDGRLVEKHQYIYVLNSGEIQDRIATCYIERRIWHRKWFPFFEMVRISLNIDFNDEVGEETGSWKGGTVGCGWEVEPDETIEQALRRMEAIRKF
jgi:hypothetical protein